MLRPPDRRARAGGRRRRGPPYVQDALPRDGSRRREQGAEEI